MDMRRLRAAAYDRQQGLCACCGLVLPDTWELHHRRPGGMGGAVGRRGQQQPGNVLALLPWHHNLTPGSVHLDPSWSRPRGYLVSTHEPIPSAVPVLLWGRTWCVLTDDGGLELVPAPAEPLEPQRGRPR